MQACFAEEVGDACDNDHIIRFCFFAVYACYNGIHIQSRGFYNEGVFK